jgi:pimeloyl-ACP methyl ester carboxylesterase
MSAQIDRAFVRLAEGLVHYRHAGAELKSATPLYMAHAGPGCSRSLAPLLAEFGVGRWTIAPDMLGNGDSAPPAREDTDIAYYADCVVRVLDALGVEQVDFYGSHTGALIGMELARSHGDRLRRLVLDGVMLLEDDERVHMLARYAPKTAPDDHGGYLLWAYQFCRDMMLFYPYFERDAEHRLPAGVPDAETLHLFVLDVMKALSTYHCAYQAAFSYDAQTALQALRHSVLITCSERDPLHGQLSQASALLPSAPVHLHPLTAGPVQIAAVVDQFLTRVQ